MTLHYDPTEGDEFGTNDQSSQIHTPTQTQSYTGNYERRLMIRILGVEFLVKEYNNFVKTIITRGTISISERQIIHSMEQEGIEVGGEFFGKIQETKGSHTIPHYTGVSKFESGQGKTDILQGETRLCFWSLVK